MNHVCDRASVAGCFLHPYQRWDCCAAEQRIRIIIMLQWLQMAEGLNGRVWIEYTFDSILIFEMVKLIFVFLWGVTITGCDVKLHTHHTHSSAALHSIHQK
jgi:hypothetical protein